MNRLFVAVDLSAAVKDQLDLLCRGVSGAKWVAPEQLHLTLRFIGEVDGPTLDEIADALAEVRAEPFELTLREVGQFPPGRAPRVLWVGVGKSEALIGLRDRIEAVLVRLGLEPEARKFSPHITLARFKQSRPKTLADFMAHHALFESDSFPVTEFHLYSSHLSSDGAIHTLEASYALSAEPRGEVVAG